MKQLKQKLFEKFGKFTKDYLSSFHANPTLEQLTSIERRPSREAAPAATRRASRQSSQSKQPVLHKYLHQSVFVTRSRTWLTPWSARKSSCGCSA